VTTLAFTGPDNLAAAEGGLLAQLRDRCAGLDAACQLASRLAEMLLGRRGQGRLGWAHDAESSALPELPTFAAGLRRDWDAVTAGLTLDWSCGQVEGHVSRIKMIKRRMFGRAEPDLLGKRVLEPVDKPIVDQRAAHPRPAGKAEEGGALVLCVDLRQRRQRGCGASRAGEGFINRLLGSPCRLESRGYAAASAQASRISATSSGVGWPARPGLAGPR
jgi:Transposase